MHDLVGIIALFTGIAIILAVGVAVLGTASSSGCDSLSGEPMYRVVAVITRTPYNVTMPVIVPAPDPEYTGGSSPLGPSNLLVIEQTTESLAYSWTAYTGTDANNMQVWTRPYPLDQTSLAVHAVLLADATAYNMTGLAEGEGVLVRIRAYDDGQTRVGQSNTARAFTATTVTQTVTLFNETTVIENRLVASANPWYDKCIEARESSQAGYVLLSLILIILAAVGILIVVRHLY